MKPLTDEERQALKETMETPGWEVFAMILDGLRQEAQRNCAMVRDDHRFAQGMYFSLDTLYNKVVTKVIIQDAPKQRVAQDYA